MTTTISPYDYCKHPEDYINSPGIDNVTRAYWDQYCTLLNASQGPPITNSQSNPGFFKKMTDGIKNGSSEFATNLIIGIITLPIQNIPFTNVPFLPVIAGPGIIKSILKSPAKWLSEQGISRPMESAIAELSESGIDTLTLNIGAIAGTTVRGIAESGVAKLAEESTFSAGKYAIAELIRATASFGVDGLIAVSDVLSKVMASLGPLMDVQLILQLVGNIFDSWDPCGLTKQLDADALQSFSHSFNNQYMETMLASISSTQDSYGHLTYNSVFPVIYYAEQSALLPFKKDYYDKIYWKLYFQYLSTLTHNSDGFQIYKSPGGKLITNHMISGWASKELGFLANGNTVVQNWMVKWLPVLLAILIFIIVFVMIIRIKYVRKNGTTGSTIQSTVRSTTQSSIKG